MKRLPAMLAALLGLAALSAPSALAQGEPQWYANNKLLAPDVPVPFQGTGNLTLHIEGLDVTCHASDGGAVINLEDESALSALERLSFSGCSAEPRVTTICPRRSKLEMAAEGLPWEGHLFSFSDGVVRDAMEGVKLHLDCSGTEEFANFEGTILPEVDPPAKLDVDEVLFFTDLHGERESEEAILTGTLKLFGPNGVKRITAYDLEG